MSETATTTIPKIGDQAPDFTAMTTHGELTFSTWAEGKWVVFFSHPADFTPVCSTELTEFARRAPEFDKRNVKLIVGRNVDEVVRLVDALQTVDKHGVACPVNWKPGEKVIVPPPKTEKDVDARLADKTLEKLDFYLAKKSIG